MEQIVDISVLPKDLKTRVETELNRIERARYQNTLVLPDGTEMHRYEESVLLFAEQLHGYCTGAHACSSQDAIRMYCYLKWRVQNWIPSRIDAQTLFLFDNGVRDLINKACVGYENTHLCRDLDSEKLRLEDTP